MISIVFDNMLKYKPQTDKEAKSIAMLFFGRFGHFIDIAFYKFMKQFSCNHFFLDSVRYSLLSTDGSRNNEKLSRRLCIRSILSTRTIEMQSDTIASIKHLILKIHKKLLSFVFQIEVNAQYSALYHFKKKDLKMPKKIYCML